MARRVLVVVGVVAGSLPLLAGQAFAVEFCNTVAVAGATGTGPSNPYPSNISVSGLTGTITDVNVRLLDVTTTGDANTPPQHWAEDLDVLVSAPNGSNVVVMSDAGGDNNVSSGAVVAADLTLDDQAPNLLPADSRLTSGTYRPVDDDDDVAGNPGGDDVWPAPAPTPSGSTTLATFNGLAPNGTWSLWAVDDQAGARVGISGGWCVDITTTGGVTGPTPSITTQVSPSAVTVGQSFTDTATVTGSAGGPAPSGTVSFVVYGPGDTTCTGTPFGSSLNRPLTGGTATSAPFTPTSVGTYRVIATYSGDVNYPSLAGACGDPNEAVTVAPAAPQIATAVSDSSISLGESFTDTATVTGPAAGPAPTGTVSFFVYGPNDPTCSGTAVFTSLNRPVGAGGTATSGTFTPTATGTYRVIAQYSGNGNHLPVSGSCNDPGETVSVGFGEAHMTLEKSASPTSGDAPLAVTYTYRLVNDGTDPIFHTTVVDDSCGPVALQSGDVNGNQLLDPGETWILRCSLTLHGTNTNTAVASGTSTQTGLGVRSNAARATVTVTPLAPEGAGMTLTKSANPTSGQAPLPVTYTYTLANTGTQSLFHTTVGDDSCGPVTLQSGDGNANQLLDPGETWTFTCSLTLTGTNTNTAMARATSTATGLAVRSNAAQATVTVAPVPPGAGMSLTKSANPTSGQAPLPVTYTYTLANTGTQPLFHTTVTDSSCGPVTLQSGDGNGNQLLDPGETWTLTCSQTLTSTTTNTATAQGTSTQTGLGVRSNQAQATVTIT